MTSRGKSAVRGFETEIEKSREEANWKKAVELAMQLKQRSPQHESLAHFLNGEGKLEAFLEESPACRENEERAARELGEARGFLALATDEAGARAGVALDAHLLLGKLHYACGGYKEALKHFNLAELSSLTEKELPVRSLRIVAESYAIRGLCLEAGAEGGEAGGAGGSRYKQAEREAEIVRAFELAADLTLLYLQRTGGAAGPLLDAALLRAPAMHARAHRLPRALDRCRDMLAAAECPATAALRLTLARQLAELLLRSAPGAAYRPPRAPPAPATLSRRRDDHAAEGPWKPRKYAGLNQFVPAAEWEEVVLVLLVGEALAARDAVLSQSAEFAAARDHALHNAVSLADLLALVATRWGQLCLLLESLERAMKFSFGATHVWRQRALATAAAHRAAAPRHRHQPHLQASGGGGGADDVPAESAGGGAGGGAGGAGGGAGGAGSMAGVRAHAVMRRALPLAPDDVPLRLVAANTCYQLGWIDEGIALAEEAVRLEGARGQGEGEEGGEEGEAADSSLCARACVVAACGYEWRAHRAAWRAAKEQAHDQALQLLLRAVRADDNDHLAFYHLALLYTRRGMLNAAMDACRACLCARAECAGGLRLACALWSCACAGARGARALHAARLARHHYPRADWPRAALATLQITWESGEAALSTGKELLALLNSPAEQDDEPNGYAELDALSDSAQDDTSLRHDAVSLRAESAGVARAERALSDTASSISRAGGAGGAGGVGGVGGGAGGAGAAERAHAWLTLAELCLRLGRVSAAAGTVSEAHALTPFSHRVLYTRGLVEAAMGEWEAARASFQNALALNPRHVDTNVALGAAYYALGWLRLAEKTLRDAAALEPRRADTWRRLALVLAALGEPLAAADCAAAALQLQPATPALALPL